jgi:hypothetical protein
MLGMPLTCKLHILLGFTILLISPFTRMIHIWSGVGALAYLFQALSKRKHAKHVRQASGADMSIMVNGVEVHVGRWASPEVAALRELLRQRATARGLLAADAPEHDVDGAIELLLAEEVSVPTPTEAECRRHYETHRADFASGALFCAHILFQVTPGVPVPEVRLAPSRR